MKKEHTERYKKLGCNIAYFRKVRNYTQMELAEVLDIDRTHMGSVEIGKSVPSLDLIFDIANALDVPEKYLFDFDLKTKKMLLIDK